MFELLATLGGKLFGIPQSRDMALRMEYHRGGDHRPRQRPAPRLIDAGEQFLRTHSTMDLAAHIISALATICPDTRASALKRQMLRTLRMMETSRIT